MLHWINVGQVHFDFMVKMCSYIFKGLKGIHSLKPRTAQLFNKTVYIQVCFFQSESQVEWMLDKIFA